MPIVKVMAGKYWTTLDIEPYSHGRYRLKFNYNQNLISEVKAMEGARWNPDEKFWTISASKRNQFTLDYLMGKNPYEKYLLNVKEFDHKRSNLMKHQHYGIDFGLSRRQCIIAGEPGVGKTLMAIEIMELSGDFHWLWVGPVSALREVRGQFLSWKSDVFPTLSTYDSLKKISSGKDFIGIIFDESQKLKNPNTQRFKEAIRLCEEMREEYDDPYIILMTGTPAPNSPSDWWSQVELICPGYIKEGTIEKFKRRMGLILQKESLVGGTYPELVTWWDNENKCKICGKLESDPLHDFEYCLTIGIEQHNFQKSNNEVESLYKRLKGIVYVIFKKDVLDLPDKIFKIIECKPSEEILRAAKLIVHTSKNAAHAAMRLRELSDGFQYQDKPSGKKTCTLCKGTKVIYHYDIEQLTMCPSCGEFEFQNNKCIACGMDIGKISESLENVECPHCAGTGEEEIYSREARQVECPKEEIVKELLEEYEDVGRVVLYAGFQGSVDRLIQICQRENWEVMRVDGRGWWSTFHQNPQQMLWEFQKGTIPKLAVVGQPDAGGLGLNYSRSPVEIFYSNSVIPGSRSQAIERIHRIGMDYNRGATIIDIIHLPTDLTLLNKLNEKKRIENMSMGELETALK